MNSGIISSLEGARVVVLGDVMLDRFVYGQVDRISPEAPIPVLLQTRQTRMLGGAANVARNIVSMGGHAVLIGVVGSDTEGREVSGPLATDAGIDGRLVEQADHPTTVKTRFVCDNQQILRLDAEQHLRPDRDLMARIEAVLADALDGAGALVLSDYGKGLLSREMVSIAIDRARSARIPVIVDPKTPDLSHYSGATVVTPNAKETQLATGIDARSDAGGDQAARAIVDASGISAALVTRGAAGMTLFAPDHGAAEPVHFSANARKVFDVSGAGDTVVATLSLMIAAGHDLSSAAGLANRAAGIAVAKPGTATVSAAELANVLTAELGVPGEVKAAATREDAVKQAAEWRAAGLKVGFANGCFDLIHPGHVKLLAQARATCDRLVVALNTDESVSRLKGPDRPLQDEQSRAAVMSAIRSVDLVTLFSEDTPLELIRLIRPDVLIKGADYTVEEVVGADLVMGWGGEVALIPLEEGHSTTRIVSRAGSDIGREIGR